jgi:hypothetical protein
MTSQSHGGDPVLETVERGYQRVLQQHALRDAGLALAIALAGPVLLLALGTELFPMALLALFLFAGVAAAGYHWWNSKPLPYRVAQVLDARWGTEDQIATAYYFTREAAENLPAAESQRQRAAQAAAAGDIAIGLPFETPRSMYWFGAMLLLSLGLFGVRYGTQASLTLGPPLWPVSQSAISATADQQQDDEQARANREGDEATPPLDSQGKLKKEEKAQKKEVLPIDALAADAGGDGQGNEELITPEVEGLSAGEEFGDELAMNAPKHDAPQGQKAEGSEKKGADGSDGSPGDQQGDKNEDWNEGSNSLLDKLKDAFQNMLARMNMEDTQQGQPSSQQAPPTDERQTADNSTGAGKQQGEGDAKAEGLNATDSQMSEGETTEGASDQMAQGQGGKDNPSKGSEGQSGAGAGSEDGAKEALEEYAQMQAMGQLSDLYQKRAEEISGEVMIETEQAQQTARTPYADRQSGHQDRGGEVSRDEIPLAYQSYIKNYFKNLESKSK